MESLLLSFGSVKLEWHHTLLSLLLSFLLSSLVAIVYEKTFRGLSWSVNLLQAMILGSMVACIIMVAIGDNIARGIGIVGSLAIIRFRTNLRDPRDLVFLFSSLAIGVACGVQSYSTAIVGTVFFCLAAGGLQITEFGKRRRHDGLVRFQLPSDGDASAHIAEIMTRIPDHFALVTRRSIAQGKMMDYAYQVRFNEDQDCERLLKELETVKGITGLSYLNQQTTVEM